MRRDLTLCESILREVRDRDGSELAAIVAHEPQEIHGHLELLAAEGFLDIGPRAVATSPGAYETRLRLAQLTWKGHDYIESVSIASLPPQNPSRWRSLLRWLPRAHALYHVAEDLLHDLGQLFRRRTSTS